MKIEEVEDLINKEISKLSSKKEKIAAEARKLDVLKHYKGEDRIISSMDRIEELKKLPPPEMLSTGFPSLDKETEGGFSPHQLVVITGLTKQGKTTFAMNLIENMSVYNPLFFSLEETPDEILRKRLKFKNDIPNFYFPAAPSTKDSWEWFEEKILESIIKYGTKMVFIDHLQFMMGYSTRKDREDLRVTEIVDALKKIAKRLNVCIVLLVHLRKAPTDQCPTLDDIKESASVAQWADKVIIVWREAKKDHNGKIELTGVTDVFLAADRQSGNVTHLPFYWEKGKYKEFNNEWEVDDLRQHNLNMANKALGIKDNEF